MSGHIIVHSQYNDSVHYYVNYASAGIINKTNDGSSYVLTKCIQI